ncbi:hypothetical protein C6P40_001672 [Pichia californica]|uniref:Copper acquisition factor BIM1-like domain-containing protein n=1 Tax=Pichia californica TaxID=460514 RepID=A0A9P6WQV5_9ASCO|nr:hypothetical protein C6P42_002936 [[Candida] californica]KAG0690727.1 hypothetical protein C6P40_001672 [[Candida] californica]
MNFKASILLSLLASTAEAHFRIPYPGERNSTNWDTQTKSPCGGDNAFVFPRYEWNPEGSPVEINYHHLYGVGAIYFCGNGNCTTGADFDELIYEPVDQTVGNFCIPALQLPSKYNKVNTTGVIQIIYGAPSNEAGDYEFMYNCIDVIVSKDGPVYDGTQCINSSTSIEHDGQVNEVEENNGDEQLNLISSISYLENVRISTQSVNSVSSKAAGSLSGSGYVSTTSLSDDMAGMDMGSTTTATITSSINMSGMPGMDMSTTIVSSYTAKSSGVASNTSTSAVEPSTASTSSSTGGANSNNNYFTISTSLIVLSVVSLFL